MMQKLKMFMSCFELHNLFLNDDDLTEMVNAEF